MVNKKIKCEDCNKNHSSRNVIFFKGKYRCKNCRNKLYGAVINTRLPIPKTEKECLERIYEIKPNSSITCLSGVCYFNKILIGKRFIIQIIDDKLNSHTKPKTKW